MWYTKPGFYQNSPSSFLPRIWEINDKMFLTDFENYDWRWPTPVFYNETACGFPGIEARILESLATWNKLEENLNIQRNTNWKNLNNQRVNWYVKGFLTWQSGQHNQAHRERSIGCKRWRLWAMASWSPWSPWLSRSWLRSWWVAVSSRHGTSAKFHWKAVFKATDW